MILEQPGAAGGAHTFGAEEVLDRVGNAMQRTAAFAARQFLVGLFGALAGNQMDELFTELKIPREFTWQEWDRDLKPLRIPRDNYSHMDGINDTQVDVGYYFDQPKRSWFHNIFANHLEGTPFPED